MTFVWKDVEHVPVNHVFHRMTFRFNGGKVSPFERGALSDVRPLLRVTPFREGCGLWWCTLTADANEVRYRSIFGGTFDDSGHGVPFLWDEVGDTHAVQNCHTSVT